MRHWILPLTPAPVADAALFGPALMAGAAHGAPEAEG